MFVWIFYRTAYKKMCVVDLYVSSWQSEVINLNDKGLEQTNSVTQYNILI